MKSKCISHIILGFQSVFCLKLCTLAGSWNRFFSRALIEVNVVLKRFSVPPNIFFISFERVIDESKKKKVYSNNDN